MKQLNIFTHLKKIVRVQQYHPGALGMFVLPNWIIRKSIRDALFENKNFLSGLVLDFGAGTRPYESFIPAEKYVGLDTYISGNRQARASDVIYDGENIPFKNIIYLVKRCYIGNVVDKKKIRCLYNLLNNL